MVSFNLIRVKYFSFFSLQSADNYVSLLVTAEFLSKVDE